MTTMVFMLLMGMVRIGVGSTDCGGDGWILGSGSAASSSGRASFNAKCADSLMVIPHEQLSNMKFRVCGTSNTDTTCTANSWSGPTEVYPALDEAIREFTTGLDEEETREYEGTLPASAFFSRGMLEPRDHNDNIQDLALYAYSLVERAEGPEQRKQCANDCRCKNQNNRCRKFLATYGDVTYFDGGVCTCTEERCRKLAKRNKRYLEEVPTSNGDCRAKYWKLNVDGVGKVTGRCVPRTMGNYDTCTIPSMMWHSLIESQFTQATRSSVGTGAGDSGQYCIQCVDFDPHTMSMLEITNEIGNPDYVAMYAIPDWTLPVTREMVCAPATESCVLPGTGGKTCGGRTRPCDYATFNKASVANGGLHEGRCASWQRLTYDDGNYYDDEGTLMKEREFYYYTPEPTDYMNEQQSLWPVWVFLGLAVGGGSAYAVSKYTSSEPAQHRPEHYFEDDPIKAEAAPVSHNVARRQVELQQQQRQEESHHSQVKMWQEQRNHAPAIGVGS